MTTGRRPVSVMDTILRGQMLDDPTTIKRIGDAASPENQWGLGIARVTQIDYEEFWVSLQVLVGASGTTERVPVPMTFPGAGARHLFGALPQIGDYCVVGWMPQESASPRNRTPVILTWLAHGVWLGREWMTASEFPVEEADLASQRQRDVLGPLARVRHKLRHMEPGNILASSAQGADIALDESVLLSNRRGNEFRLRDQDQAAVLRALQQFTALAGTRTYSGMVQRDALFLATTMVSDGKVWDGPRQILNGEPLHETDLPSDPNTPVGSLKPARVLSKGFTAEGVPYRNLFNLSPNIDPYQFLQAAGFLTAGGVVVDGRYQADGIYGGKAVYRVPATGKGNSATNPKAPALTEHRLEVAHTSDGQLPVTDQTDAFDADRLPGSDPDSPGAASPNRPFIQVVHGSVVGNDPFTAAGRAAYGRPMVARIFDGEVPAPRMEAVEFTAEANDGATLTPLLEHAATLFQLDPLNGDRPTFWSVNKKGQLRASLSGPKRENSLEAFLSGGLKLQVAGALQLLLDGGLHFGTNSKNSVHVSSEQGAVTIYGGGPVKGSEAAGERLAGTGGRESDLPSVAIEAKTNVRIRASRKVMLKGGIIESQATANRIHGHDLVEVRSAKKIAVSSEAMDFVCSGKRTDNFAGPKQFLPTNGALHERTYTPSIPGLTCEKATYTWGDREETFLLGNHTTQILVGDMAYRTLLGTATLQAVTSSMQLGATGIEGLAAAGNVSLSAVAGQAIMSGLAGVTVQSPAGVATVRGALSLYLGAPLYGPDAGPIVCSGSLEPFTALPFGTWGIGARGHIVGA